METDPPTGWTRRRPDGKSRAREAVHEIGEPRSRTGSRITEEAVRMAKALTLPTTPEAIRALSLGDEVRLRGRIITGREAAHRHLAWRDDARVRRWASGSLVYHCAPVVSRAPPADAWRFVAAGPSRSLGAEPWEAEVIARCGLRGVMGRGGMGDRTLRALEQRGAVYLHAAGGLALTLARCVRRVVDVHLLEALGVAEAIWLVEVEDFPAVVTMDAHGRSLHAPRGAPGDGRGERAGGAAEPA